MGEERSHMWNQIRAGWKQRVGTGYRAFLGVTALLALVGLTAIFPGSDLLKGMGLQWRSGAYVTLGLVGFGSAILFQGAMARLLLTRLRGQGRTRVLTALLALVLAIGSLVSGWMGIVLVVFGLQKEHVVDWEGQKCVQVEYRFLGNWDRWYPYHGPFVMGTERVHSVEHFLWLP